MTRSRPASAAPPGSGRWVRARLDRVVLRRPLATPLLLATVIGLVAAAALTTLLASVMPDPADAVLARTWIWLAAAVAPAVHLGKALVVGILGWSFLTLLGGRVELRPLVSGALFGQALLAVNPLVLALFLALFPPTEPGSLAAALPSALGGLAGSGSALSMALGRAATPLHVPWTLFLALLFSRAANVPFRHGLLSALTLWWVLILATWIQIELLAPPLP